ncbi:MAG: hypothetical protein K9G11_00310 [Rickettsiaceae bacterium]|nr:hypothetical protein [Rickettsiaceae bacterium]
MSKITDKNEALSKEDEQEIKDRREHITQFFLKPIEEKMKEGMKQRTDKSEAEIDFQVKHNFNSKFQYVTGMVKSGETLSEDYQRLYDVGKLYYQFRDWDSSSAKKKSKDDFNNFVADHKTLESKWGEKNNTRELLHPFFSKREKEAAIENFADKLSALYVSLRSERDKKPLDTNNVPSEVDKEPTVPKIVGLNNVTNILYDGADYNTHKPIINMFELDGTKFSNAQENLEKLTEKINKICKQEVGNNLPQASLGTRIKDGLKQFFQTIVFGRAEASERQTEREKKRQATSVKLKLKKEIDTIKMELESNNSKTTAGKSSSNQSPKSNSAIEIS